MINHVVLFKLKEYSATEKADVLAKLKGMLLDLKGKIAELKYIEVGENYELDSKSYDMALLSHFETIDALDVYRIHPEHQKVLAYISEITVARAAVDYKF